MGDRVRKSSKAGTRTPHHQLKSRGSTMRLDKTGEKTKQRTWVLSRTSAVFQSTRCRSGWWPSASAIGMMALNQSIPATKEATWCVRDRERPSSATFQAGNRRAADLRTSAASMAAGQGIKCARQPPIQRNSSTKSTHRRKEKPRQGRVRASPQAKKRREYTRSAARIQDYPPSPVSSSLPSQATVL